MSQDSKLVLVQEMILAAESKLKSAKQILSELTGESPKAASSAPMPDIEERTKELNPQTKEEGQTVIEGIFNGQSMIDQSGKEYPIPANYASKSKLVPGDVLKLTIKEDGGLLYKQIGPIERKTVIGTLTYEDGQYKVIANGKAYKVLLASVTYFKGEVGDKVTLVVPANEEGDWGAIETILPQEAA